MQLPHRAAAGVCVVNTWAAVAGGPAEVLPSDGPVCELWKSVAHVSGLQSASVTVNLAGPPLGPAGCIRCLRGCLNERGAAFEWWAATNYEMVALQTCRLLAFYVRDVEPHCLKHAI
jgi:hypothetical protein